MLDAPLFALLLSLDIWCFIQYVCASVPSHADQFPLFLAAQFLVFATPFLLLITPTFPGVAIVAGLWCTAQFLVFATPLFLLITPTFPGVAIVAWAANLLHIATPLLLLTTPAFLGSAIMRIFGTQPWLLLALIAVSLNARLSSFLAEICT